MNSLTNPRHLGDLLRRKREALAASDSALAGRPGAGRRRTPGLRREEVAEMAGISLDWYTRLEQGRATSASLSTLQRLSQVLQLTPAESYLLNKLCEMYRSDKKIPSRAKRQAIAVPGYVRDLLSRLPGPAYVLGPRYDLVYQNDAAAVFTHFFQKTPKDLGVRLTKSLDHNLIYQFFVAPGAREIFVDWEAEAQNLVEGFRLSFELHSHLPEFREVVEVLYLLSPKFKEFWESNQVRVIAGGTKCLNLTPGLQDRAPRSKEKGTRIQSGRVTWSYAAFRVLDNPSLMAVIYGP